ncbi:MAG: hypothetical protein A2052_06405 [Deltaproteobacteria bacterium GWA2_54_12]|nr:MAG: hypothetical protein A2052_06405 [Deltaproteobacteria bacterium GWA2_54_12]
MARRLKLFIATSLDGYIARMDGSIDWLFTDADYGYKDFFSSIDTVVAGRKTYEQALTLENNPFSGKQCYVFTRKASGKSGPVTFVSGDIAEFTKGLKDEPGSDIWLVGGSETIAALKHLIDDFIISIHPRILGGGIALFTGEWTETGLELVNSASFDSGLVQLHYRVP